MRCMNREPLILALAGIPFLKAEEKIKLLDNLDNLKDLALLSIEDISAIAGRRIRSTLWNPGQLEQRYEKTAMLLRLYSINWCGLWERDFPPLLREIYDPPFVLFWRGRLPDPERPSAAVVGTRRPTGRGLEAAFALGAEFASAGIPVISGLARGIDSAAHQGALSAGGCTAAVLACGADRVYPVSSSSAAARMLERGGALISEYLPGDEPLKWRFPQRNRLISGFSRGVIVVEAPEKSGALITADYALEQGRDLFMHTIAAESPAGKGAQKYIEDGAVLIRGAADILHIWEHEMMPVFAPAADTEQRSAGEQLAFEFERELANAKTSVMF